MNLEDNLIRLKEFSPRIFSIVEKVLQKLPFVQREMASKTDSVMSSLDDMTRPYRHDYTAYKTIPQLALERDQVKKIMRELSEKEAPKWQKGYASGAVYHGEQEHIDFLDEVYSLNSQTNPLHSDMFPSVAKYEAEIIAMVASMLGSHETQEYICGSVSSGGTESILLAMKAYRDYALEIKGIKNPEIVVPVTAHAAFHKAAHYFGLKLKLIDFDKDYRVDVAAVKKAITRNTIALVVSAPTFPHGVIDPIEEVSNLGLDKGIPVHVDACLGGFILPWAKKLGYAVPKFDFSLPGVTSISVDTHKYGFAPKGTSVILYRGEQFRSYQYFTITDWPGGLYFSPTLAGSRSGALSAGCWATLLTMGEDGYLKTTQKILETAAKIKKGIGSIPELKILGKPLWNIAFASNKVNIYQVMDQMSKKGWILNGLHKPSCVHLCVTLMQTRDGVADSFIYDLQQSVKHVKENEPAGEGMAPIYGMASSVPFRGAVSTLLKKYMDALYKA